MAYSEALVETWCLYGVGSLMIALRSLCRWRMVGFRGFDPDDYIVLFSWVVYSIMTYAADVCDRHADLHTLSITQRKSMSTEDAGPYIRTTQWFCAGVATYVVFVWSLKLNMLFFYKRVVNGLWVEKFIMPAMCLVGLTFIVNMGILFGSCRPYGRMWVFYEDEGGLCEPQATIYMLPTLIMNILTDLAIMLIPAPVVLQVRMGIMKKVSLVVLFSGGFFIMIAAILRVTYVMVQQNGAAAAIWSCREDFVAILVGQAPMLRPALSRNFWTQEDRINTASSSYGRSSKPRSMPISDSSGHDAFDMAKVKRQGPNNYKVTITTRTEQKDSDSTDRIIDGGIMVDRHVDVYTDVANRV